jgi:hypothetical protein
MTPRYSNRRLCQITSRSGRSGPGKPYVPVNAIKEVLLELGEKDPKVASLKPEDFADMSFVKELDESGFIDALYKGKAK